MYYIVTFNKPTTPTRHLTEQFTTKNAANRWKVRLVRNGYQVVRTVRVLKKEVKG